MLCLSMCAASLNVCCASQDEIVLVTTERPDGTCARIVFRNGGYDDASTLEKLCEKVSPLHCR